MTSPTEVRRTKSVRRRPLTAAAVGLLAIGGLVAGAPASLAASTPAATTPACPTGAFAFNSTLSNGAFAIGKNATASGASATACGSITSLNGGLGSVVKKENVNFSPTSTKVLFLNLPTTVAPTTDLSGPATLNANGSIDVSLAGSVLVTADVLGSKCSFPLDLNLTTGKSGTLTGTSLVRDAASGQFKGKLVANDFKVPALKSSSSCNVLFAGVTNGILGLPLAAGKSTITFDLALQLGVTA